jgi:hypothetical protein
MVLEVSYFQEKILDHLVAYFFCESAGLVCFLVPSPKVSPNARTQHFSGAPSFGFLDILGHCVPDLRLCCVLVTRIRIRRLPSYGGAHSSSRFGRGQSARSAVLDMPSGIQRRDRARLRGQAAARSVPKSGGVCLRAHLAHGPVALAQVKAVPLYHASAIMVIGWQRRLTGSRLESLGGWC